MTPRICLSFFTVFLLHVALATSTAQVAVVDGFIVTTANDTVRGKFEYARRGFETKVVFGRGGSKKIELLRPSEVKVIFADRFLHYESKEVKGKVMFLKVVTKGAG